MVIEAEQALKIRVPLVQILVSAPTNSRGYSFFGCDPFFASGQSLVNLNIFQITIQQAVITGFCSTALSSSPLP